MKSYVAPPSDSQRIAAEAIYVAVREGDVTVAEQLLAARAHCAREPGANHLAGVHVLSHILASQRSLKGVWEFMVLCLLDSGKDDRCAAAGYLSYLGVRGAAGQATFMQQLLRQGWGGQALSDESRTVVLQVVASMATCAELNSSEKSCLANMSISGMLDLDPATCLASLSTLGNLGHSAPPFAIPFVIAQLQARGDSVCLPACRTLQSIAKRGDVEAVGAVAWALQHFSGPMDDRIELARCLQSLAAIDGDRAATEAFLSLLRGFPHCPEIKAAALWGLESVAVAGHAAARAAALDQLSCMPAAGLFVLTAAIATLKKVCHLGDVDAAGSLLKVLAEKSSARSPILLTDVISALVEICPLGDPHIILELGKQLGSGAWPVRRAILQAVRVLAPASCCSAEAKAVALKGLADLHPDVRESAVEALASVVPVGDVEALAALERLRADEQPISVEMAIDEAFEALSGDTLQGGIPQPSALWVPEKPPAGARSQCSFQFLDTASQCSSFHIIDGAGGHADAHSKAGSSDGSFQVVEQARKAASESSFHMIGAPSASGTFSFGSGSDIEA